MAVRIPAILELDGPYISLGTEGERIREGGREWGAREGK